MVQQFCFACHCRRLNSSSYGAQSRPTDQAENRQAARQTGVLSNVRSTNESYPLERVEEASNRVLSGKARFRG
jgi:hypothetical protein